mmetsp:Transcript_19078/g.44588  ORF Transcript_19078/g.44588 Transcript_19078/m.44588 type:complete len:575 (-) Transcript_19078:7-1731(-)
MLLRRLAVPALFLLCEVNAATLRKARWLRIPGPQEAQDEAATAFLSLSGQEAEDLPDDDVRDKFIERCATVTTVRDESYLPIKALERLCDGTDSVVECKLRVVKRVKDTHARGGDMQQACAAIYEWFQKKYGDECPNQCRKLQCQATCEWLDDHEAVTQNETLDEMESQLKEMKTELSELEDELADAKSKTREQDNLCSRVEVKLGRAKSALDAALEAEKNQQQQLSIEEAAAKQDAARVASMMKQQEAAEEEAVNIGRELDFAKLDQTQAEEKAEKAVKAFNEAQTASAAAEQQVQGAQQELQSLKAEAQRKADAVEAVEGQIEDLAPVLDKKLKAMQQAERNEDQALKDGSSQETLDVAADLVKQQTARYQETQAQMTALERELEVAQNAERLALEEVSAAKAKKKQLKSEAATVSSDLAAAKTEMSARQTAASRAESATKALEAKLEEQERIIAEGAKALKAAGLTLKSREEILGREKGRLQQAEEEVQKATAEFELLTTTSKNEKEKLERLAKKLDAKVKAVKAATAAWNSLSAEFQWGLDFQSDSIRQLNKRKPEIVRQHGLALLQALQ